MTFFHVRRLAHLTCSLGTLALLLSLTGCGSKTGKVTGKVTLNGQPLKSGTVSFVPDATGKEKKVPASVQIKDGTYTLDKAPVGPGVFLVNCTDFISLRTELDRLNNERDLNPGGAAPSADQQKILDESKKAKEKKIKELEEKLQNAVAVPLSYNDAKQSPLKFDVKPGSNVKDLEMTGQADPTQMLPPNLRH